MSRRPRPGILFLALVIAAASVGTNAAIPTVPGIEAAFSLGAGTGAGIVGTFAIGYAIGHLLLALIADRSNQQYLLITSLAGFTVASVVIAIANDPAMVFWARFSQGLFASSGPIIGRAIICAGGDFETAAKKMSGASAIFTWAPVVAPAIAGLLVSWSGWRSVYILLSLYGLCVCWLAMRANRQWFPIRAARPVSPGDIGSDLAALAKHRDFQRGTMAAAFVFGGFLAMLAAMPDLAERRYGSGVSLAYLVTTVAAAYAAGGSVSRLWLNSADSESILKRVSGAALFLGPLLLINATFLEQQWITNVVLVAYSLSAGIINPNATILAMRGIPDSAAMAAALVGSAKMSVAAAAAAILGIFATHTDMTLGWVLTGFTILALAGTVSIRSRERDQAVSP